MSSGMIIRKLRWSILYILAQVNGNLASIDLISMISV